MILISTSFHDINSAIVPILSSSANVGFLQYHMERVIGYKIIEKDVVTSRPCKWDGITNPNGLQDLPELTQKRIVYRPIYEDLGPKVNTTLEDPIIRIRDFPTWGNNTDDARGKKRK